MKAIILAAGVGSRLSPLTNELPKTLVEIKGKPMINYILDNLTGLNIDEIIIVLGHFAHKIGEHLGEKYKGIPIKYTFNPIYKQTNSTYSLWLTKDIAGDEFLVINADTLFDKEIAKDLIQSNGEIAMSIDDSIEGINRKDAMRVTIENGLIKDADKKIPIERTHGDAIGLYKFKGQGAKILFSEIQKLIDENIYDQLFTFAVRRVMERFDVYPVSTKCLPWTEIDDKEDLQEAEKIINKISSEKMKAAVYVGNSKIEIKEIPIPEINDDEILLNVKLVGLCKTDVKKIIHNWFEPPRVFGHEIVGEIEKVGKNIKNFNKGDRVAVFHHVPCLNCFHCKNRNYAQCKTYREVDTTAGYGEKSGGGFAEYIKIPKIVIERGLIKIPNNISNEEAIFIEPLNCCHKAVKKAKLEIDDSVLIIAQGSIGLMITKLCKLAGVKKIITTDLIENKLILSERYGADLALKTDDPLFLDKIKNFNEGNLPNKCFIAVESLDAVNQGLKAISPGGRLIFVFDKIEEKNLSIDPNIISNKEIDIIGSYSSDYSLHEETSNLIFNKRIILKDLITHEFKLEELEKSIIMAYDARASIKILIKL